MYVFVIPNSKPTNGISKRKRAATFDWTGAVLSIAGFTLPIMAIQFGGLIYPWNSATTIVLFVVGGLCWVVFAFQQTYNILTTTENRMFPVHLMYNKEAVLLFLIGTCVATVSYVDVYYIPLYFQFTRGDSAIITAKRMLPFIFMLITFVLASGFLMSRYGLYKPWYVCGSALALIGSVLMCKSHPNDLMHLLTASLAARIGVETSTSAIYGYEALIGIGAGAYTQANFAVIQANIEPKDAGPGITLMLIGEQSGNHAA